MRKYGAVAFVVLILVAPYLSGAKRDTSWPDLYWIWGVPTADEACPVWGTATKGTHKGDINELKNRYTLPSKFTTITYEDMMNLPYDDEDEIEANNQRGVTLIAYVREARKEGKETCNCGATKIEMVDTHWMLSPSQNSTSSKKTLVAETTHRGRILASMGLLNSNIGDDWSRKNLVDEVEGHWVKISGWLFYDDIHEVDSWNTDPHDISGQSANWRATCWEIHPIMAIEVLPGKP